jgi:uncharacterized protein YbjT (DUF2867 family)
MRILLTGATGMVGGGVLRECLDDPRITQVLALGRKPSGLTHPKLRDLVRANLASYADIGDAFKGFDACFFCAGVSAVGLDEPRYTAVTYGLTIAAAEAFAAANPAKVFCYVSGEGTDSTERGRSMWARVKGRTENRLLAMPLSAYMFRPGYIQPRKGVRSKTGWYQAFYTVMGPLYPLLRVFFGRHMTTAQSVGRAMIATAAGLAGDKRILENDDINRLAARAAG